MQHGAFNTHVARWCGISFVCAIAMLVGGCRLDMHIQPKYLPYEPTNFFGDGRSERQPVTGTVARGQLRLDELLYTGKENGVIADKFPFPITRGIWSGDASATTFTAL